MILDKSITIPTETAYRVVLKDSATGGGLYHYLRHQYKKYRKRYGKNDGRGKMPNQIDIDNNPDVVEQRRCIGCNPPQ